MSLVTIGTPQLRSYTFPALVAGVSPALTGAGAPTSSSQLISIVRKTSGGSPGVPVAKFVPAEVTFTGAGPVPPAVPINVATSAAACVLFSTDAGDFSVYTLYWVDLVQESPYFTAAAGVGQLFAA